jgi:hypothetical protein
MALESLFAKLWAVMIRKWGNRIVFENSKKSVRAFLELSMPKTIADQMHLCRVYAGKKIANVPRDVQIPLAEARKARRINDCRVTKYIVIFEDVYRELAGETPLKKLPKAKSRTSMDGDEASEITDSTGAKGNKKGSAPTTPASDTKQPPEFKRAPEKPSNLFDDAVEVTSEAVASMNVGSKPQTRKGAGRRRATIPDETLRILIEKWLHQVPPDSRVHCPIFSKQQNWHLLENRGLIVSKNETCPNRVCIIGFPPNNAAVRYIKEWYMSGVPFCMLARLDLIGMRCLARVFDQYGLFVHLVVNKSNVRTRCIN